jgi:hypothetical protein
VAVLSFLKYGLMALALYALFSYELVNHWAFLAGMVSTLVVCVVSGITVFGGKVSEGVA